jgi:hypothetical protein
MDRANRLQIFWWAAALAGAVMFVMGFLPSFEIRLGATVGADNTQKTYDYVRSWSLASYGTTLSIAALIASVALVAASILGVTRRGSVAALAAVTVLALALNAFTSSAGFVNDYSPDSAESCSSWAQCGGTVLNPGVQRLRRAAAKKPEAKLPEYELDPPAYTARPFAPWRVIQFGSLILLCAAGFLLFRSVPLLLWAGPVLGPLSLFAASQWSSSIECPVATAEMNEGGLALYPALFGLLSGVAALSIKRRKLGAAILVITVLTGLFALVTVGLTCENS